MDSLQDWNVMDLKNHIRSIPNFPVEGILFYDIATLLREPAAMKHCLDAFETVLKSWEPDVIAGVESRGFLFATPLAERLNLPMMMIRKAGKLPGATRSLTYGLEYGTDTIEIHTDATGDRGRVLLVDDLLATGGTMEAAIKLVQRVGGIPVAAAVIIELGFLPGRERLGDIPVHSLMTV